MSSQKQGLFPEGFLRPLADQALGASHVSYKCSGGDSTAQAREQVEDAPDGRGQNDQVCITDSIGDVLAGFVDGSGGQRPPQDLGPISADTDTFESSPLQGKPPGPAHEA
jgi:hypothetical protein